MGESIGTAGETDDSGEANFCIVELVEARVAGMIAMGIVLRRLALEQLSAPMTPSNCVMNMNASAYRLILRIHVLPENGTPV